MQTEHQRFRIYRKTHTPDQGFTDAVRCCVPSPIKGFFLPGESRHPKIALSRIYFWLLSRGKLKIYYILSEDGQVAHTSFVVPRCGKFPFLGQKDYEIGPCQTAEEYRGKGLYGMALHRITSEKGNEQADFYMLVSEDNAASIRGIEKAGFSRDGYAIRKGWRKVYAREAETE